jgi:phospholipid/cholesterol/gamma-HCH transport system substrate-binding protein
MTPFREQNKTVIGVVGIAAIIGLIAFTFNLDKIIGGEVYRADFSDAAGLRPEDEVRVAGVKVGKVLDVDLAGDRVRVEFRAKDVTLGEATRADIRIKTILGRKFLMITPDGDGAMDEGEVIPMSRTTSPFDVTEAFGDLSTTVEGIDNQQLAQSFTVLADAFRDTPDDVRASLEGLSRLSQTLASRDDQLRELLRRTEGVSQVLAERDEDLVSFLADSSLVLQELRERRQVISDLLDSTVSLSEQLRALVRENRADLAPALERLRTVSAVLRKNKDNLDAALVRLAPFVRVFSDNLGNGRWFDSVVENFIDPSDQLGFTPGCFGKPEIPSCNSEPPEPRNPGDTQGDNP